MPSRLLLQVAVTLLAGLIGTRTGTLRGAEQLTHAHAHNDYWHQRPLADALRLGFTSVEADIFLVNGQLLVGHDLAELNPERTLESLYLAPLARRVRENGGQVYPGGHRFYLLIDVKSDADDTYRHLHPLLEKYGDMLTKVERGKARTGAVTVILSGNRPVQSLIDAEVCFAGLDGRIHDLESRTPAASMPMISDNWSSHFHWRGVGPMPPMERERLKEIVRKAHEAHRVVRFWATPENENIWRELRSEGVDLIGTDQLDRLAEFLARDEAPLERSLPSLRLPARSPIELRRIAKLGPGAGDENSGIVRSRQHPDVFWLHNDSGDEPRIYPVNRRGETYPSSRYPDKPGVLIGGAINVDWEDIAIDADGHIIIADVGNNDNDRRDLVLYYLDEPAPTAGRTTFRKRVFLRYPDQQCIPASRDHFDFDCEAVFTVNNTVYLLSKNRSNDSTSLYRLDKTTPEEVNVLTRLETFDIQGQAVGADCTPDGKRLAVLTYTAIWLFERAELDQGFFQQRIFWAPFPKRDAEAICFADDEHLLVVDESLGELYEVRISDLTRVQ